tara:strand:- start:345 stop:527 length:183 start_codon:yes stop_codon:yes gene_type:complete
MNNKLWEVMLKPDKDYCYDSKLYAGYVVKKFKGSETQLKRFIKAQIASKLYTEAKFIELV